MTGKIIKGIAGFYYDLENTTWVTTPEPEPEPTPDAPEEQTEE